MDWLGPGTEEGGTGRMKEGIQETTKEGGFNVTRHRGCPSNKPSSSILSFISLNPIHHIFIVPSLPEYHLLILSKHLLINSLHHWVNDRHREVKVKQAGKDESSPSFSVKVIGVSQENVLKNLIYRPDGGPFMWIKHAEVFFVSFLFFIYIHENLVDVLKHLHRVKWSKNWVNWQG